MDSVGTRKGDLSGLDRSTPPAEALQPKTVAPAPEPEAPRAPVAPERTQLERLQNVDYDSAAALNEAAKNPDTAVYGYIFDYSSITDRIRVMETEHDTDLYEVYIKKRGRRFVTYREVPKVIEGETKYVTRRIDSSSSLAAAAKSAADYLKERRSKVQAIESVR